MKQTAFWRKNRTVYTMFKIYSTYICWINIWNATLEVSGAVRPLYGSLGIKGLKKTLWSRYCVFRATYYTNFILNQPFAYTMHIYVRYSLLPSGNACYHSVQNLLSSSVLSRNVQIKIYRTITLFVLLYGSETWSLILREERRLKVFENRVLRRIFGPEKDKVMGLEKTTKWRA